MCKQILENDWYNCTVIEINKSDNPLCVLGVLTTDAGVEIEKEMVTILQKHYHVFEVIQNAPGVLYEYPALKFAQKLAVETNKPCLYVHTKGAASINHIQPHVRLLWYTQFINHKNEYFKFADSNEETVVCPFTGSGRETWFNGFVANPQAMRTIDLQPSNDRYDFEHIFRNYPNVNIIGVLDNNIDGTNLNVMFTKLHKTNAIEQQKLLSLL